MRTEDPKNEADIADSKAESKLNDSVPTDDASKKEQGGRGGLDPTRYGDWEKAGRCIDF